MQNVTCKMQSLKLFLCALVFVALGLFFYVSRADALLTKQLSYQGRLNGASGQPVPDGTYSIVFSIYNVATGGSALWTETQNVQVDKGGFSAYLGSVTPLNLPFNEDYFLGIKVGSDPEMTPRLKLAVVGTAAFALDAGNLGGQPPTAFAPATHSHGGVTQIVAGTNVSISPAGGTGVVTINAAAAGGGGTPLTPAATVTSIGKPSTPGTSLNYAREDHVHDIPAGFIMDAMIANTAGIATSKLSGTVTAIPGNGLGALAVKNAVGSPDIVDTSIQFVDIASNACTSGQIMKYNGSAWTCDVDLTGGGGGAYVSLSPTVTQTVQGTTASVTPLALQGQSAQSVPLLDIKDFSSVSLVKVGASGNLLVGSPAQTAPKLSVEDASVNPAIAIKSTGSGTALDVWQAGTGMGAVVSMNNPGNANPLIEGDTAGTGNLLLLSKSGVSKFVVDNAGNITVGGAANAVKNNPSANQIVQPTADVVPLIIKDDAGSVADLLDVQNNGGTSLVKVGASGNLLVGNPTTTTAKVSAYDTGTANMAGYFEINNAANGNPAVIGETNGAGSAVQGITTGTGISGSFSVSNVSNANPAVQGFTNGTGVAGNFDINNAGNSVSVIKGNTTGTGNLLQLQQGAVNQFIVANNGKLTFSTGANKAVGTGTVNAATACTTVGNTSVIAGSIVLLTITSANTGADIEPLKVKTITPSASFDVCTVKETTAHSLGINFSYLIVN